MKILAVDPSVNNVGLAHYNSDTQELRTTLYHPPKESMTHVGSYTFRHIYINFLQGEKIDKLVIEYPSWQASERGLIAAQQGYTLDLAYLCGVIVMGFHLAPCNVHLLTPQQWKGNTPKKATEHRVIEQFGKLQISEHEYDAVGMLMYLCKKTGIPL